MKTMKQLRYILASSLLLLGSCSILDIEPTSEWNAESVPTEMNHVEAILYGGYQRLGSALVSGFVYYGDARADVYYANGTTAVSQDKMIRSTLEIEMSQANWSNFYQVVKQANLNIYHIPRMIEAGTIEADEAEDFLGQSYVLRAYTYFWMVRIWGGVPLVLEPIFTANDNITIPRSSIEKVFEQIHSDLDQAILYLDNPSSSSYVKKQTTFNYWSALGLRAHAYMWQHNYTEALPVLDELINEGGYKLTELYDASLTLKDNSAARTEIAKTAYSKMFNSELASGSPESIFELSFSTADGDSNTAFDGMWSGTTPTLVAREDLAEIFGLDDYRFYAGFRQLSGGKRKAMKWVMNFTRGDARNVVLMRLADFILLRAEARLCLAGDNLTDAEKEAVVADLNQIVTRAKGPDFAWVPTGDSDTSYEFFTKEDFFDQVKLERRKELVFEGQRWFDLIRWGDVNKALGEMVEAESATYIFDTGAHQLKVGDSFESGQLVWPIYLNEIRRSNGKIEQNQYYK